MYFHFIFHSQTVTEKSITMNVAIDILIPKMQLLTRQLVDAVASFDVDAIRVAMASLEDAVFLAEYTIEVHNTEVVDHTLGSADDEEEQPNPRGIQRAAPARGGPLELDPPPGASEGED